ncbi:MULTISPECIES: hypothetical protein [Paraliobacillus]|nr:MULTISPECIES: hypothetical protein [Paraliobacillus]
MPKNKQAKQNVDYMEPEFAGTDPQKVKKTNSKRCKRRPRCNDFS